MPTFHTTSIDGIYPWLIEIGEHVIVSTDVCITAHDASTTPFLGYAKLGTVSIGNNVYIGQGATILCGVKIGDNVIVGAKALVNKDLESNGVYVGVPAKRICSLEEYLNKCKLVKDNLPVFENNFLYWQSASDEEKMEMKSKIKECGGDISNRALLSSNKIAFNKHYLPLLLCLI